MLVSEGHIVLDYHLLFYNSNDVFWIETLFYQVHSWLIYIYISKSLHS